MFNDSTTLTTDSNTLRDTTYLCQDQQQPQSQQLRHQQQPGQQDNSDMMMPQPGTPGTRMPPGTNDSSGGGNFNMWFGQDGGAGRPPNPPAGGAASNDSPSNAEASGSKKKKRRTDGESPSIEEKRTKTGRACDACRSKKIRCDIMSVDPGNGEAQPICAHCKQYNIECTFFLPITETRFKKRRQAAEDGGGSGSQTKTENGAAAAATGTANGGPRPAGPTSIPFLLGNAIPTRSFEQFDIANHSHWEVTRESNGSFRVEATHDSGDSDGTRSARLERYVLPGNVMSALVNNYFNNDRQFLPVITREEFAATTNPHPLLLYAICGIAATHRESPRHVFNRLRGLVNGLLRSNEILSHARIEHVQALLIISQSGELHAQPAAPTASAAMMRLTAAIRMAQELGLHREPKTKPQTPAELQLMECKRRIWAAGVFLDRWYANALGLPQLVDIHDCDVRMPAPHTIVPGMDPKEWPIDQSLLNLNHNLQLALISGRILKMIYGPTGLTHATDGAIRRIMDDLIAWRENLPEVLKFKGPKETTLLGGWLHLEYSAVLFLFFRGFIRVTHPPPPHIKFTVDPAHWADLVKYSREVILWLNFNDTLLDTFFIFPYSATSAALVQYHTWSRKRDPAALEMLKVVHHMVQRWEGAVNPDQMSIRRKSCETMTLLYEAALKTNPDSDGDRTDRSEGTPASVGSGPGTAGSGSGASGLGSAGNAASGAGAAGVVQRSAAGASTAAVPVLSGNTAFGNVEGDGPQVVEYSHAPETNATVAVFDDAGEFDISFLDNIPESNFDWSGWGQYFETVDRMFPTPGAADSEA